MDTEYHPLYDVKRAGFKEDLRDSTQRLSEARESALNDMLDIILHHKKEIVKVPQCSTLKGARAWVAKRPNSGFRADIADIGGDSEQEVVVYDKAGRPFIVNGYKLKASDYGLRKAYWTANPTPEQRAGNPMRAWAQDYVWSSKKDEHNVWNSSITKNSENYDKMKSWGYRMPTKPKTKISPYAIFSKCVADFVKDVLSDFTTESIKDHNGNDIAAPNLYTRFRHVFGKNSKSGDNNYKFLKKLISPISIYRYLYMATVEQKYFFALKDSPQTKKIVRSYADYKKFVRDNKETFRNWFLQNVMDGRVNYAKFKTAWINKQVVLDKLAKGDLDINGTDLEDGIVFLIGVQNFKKVISLGNGQYQFNVQDLLCNNEIAGDFLSALENKKDPFHRECKQKFETLKRISQVSMENYFKNDEVKKHFFDNAVAENNYKASINEGVVNANDADSLARQQAAADSPIKKKPDVEPKKEEEIDEQAEKYAQDEEDYLDEMSKEAEKE